MKRLLLVMVSVVSCTNVFSAEKQPPISAICGVANAWGSRAQERTKLIQEIQSAKAENRCTMELQKLLGFHIFYAMGTHQVQELAKAGADFNVRRYASEFGIRAFPAGFTDSSDFTPMQAAAYYAVTLERNGENPLYAFPSLDIMLYLSGHHGFPLKDAQEVVDAFAGPRTDLAVQQMLNFYKALNGAMLSGITYQIGPKTGKEAPKFCGVNNLCIEPKAFYY